MTMMVTRESGSLLGFSSARAFVNEFSHFELLRVAERGPCGFRNVIEMMVLFQKTIFRQFRLVGENFHRLEQG